MKPAPEFGGAVVRDSLDGDIPAVRDIYAHYVLNDLASFEETPPDEAEIGRRRAAILDRGLPYLVAEVDGAVRGFAYAAPYRPRVAYRYTVEDSIYVAPDAMGQGLGRALLVDLIERCTALGYRQMIAIIGDSANHASIHLHGTLGFDRAGMLASVGFKFGRWVDSVIMQRPLGDGAGTLPRP